MPVTFEGELREGRFLERPNRFVVVVGLEGERIRAHCPNPGRLGEFLHEHTPFLVRRRPDATPDQATRWSVAAAMDGRFHVDSDLDLGQAPPPGERDFDDGAWVILDTQKANALVADALDRGELHDVLGTSSHHEPEPAAREGRFDFRLETDAGSRMVEVKSVTLVAEDGRTALFPDAPTERGTRHVRELTERAREGEQATVLFVAMREDVDRVAPNASTDPAFAEALGRAAEAGVDVRAIRARFDGEQLWLGERLPVRLNP